MTIAIIIAAVAMGILVGFAIGNRWAKRPGKPFGRLIVDLTGERELYRIEVNDLSMLPTASRVYLDVVVEDYDDIPVRMNNTGFYENKNQKGDLS